jgi:type IV secretory pathway VirB2 component (pilin)
MKKTFSFLLKSSTISFAILSIIPVLFPELSSQALAQTAANNSSFASSNQLVATLCNAVKIVTGNGGKAFAAFAIISIGIGFFTGKVSWGLMIGVAAGIAAMFGAPSIVAAITGQTVFEC